MSPASPPSDAPIEQGMIVRLRDHVWAVTNVRATSPDGADRVHKADLECLTEADLGRQLSVIWEREVGPTVITNVALPEVTGLDAPELFDAFITALRWSCASIAEGTAVQAPFRGGVEIEEEQLVPVVRASEAFTRLIECAELITSISHLSPNSFRSASC